MEYSYQFSEELQQEWEWTERYATQPEILEYANHVADRFDLRATSSSRPGSVSRRTTRPRAGGRCATDGGDGVVGAVRDHGDRLPVVGEHPRLSGPRRFEGPTYHTGRWPHEGVDFTGKRVAVIGTGSSGIQSIPIIAAAGRASSPCSSAPRATRFPRATARSTPRTERRSRPTTPASGRETADCRRRSARATLASSSALAVADEERERDYEERWEHGGLPFLGAYIDLLIDQNANETAAEFVRNKIREIVKDPEVAELLSPKTVIGCKRLCVDTGYFETFNRANVELVDVSETPIDEITPARRCASATASSRSTASCSRPGSTR